MTCLGNSIECRLTATGRGFFTLFRMTCLGYGIDRRLTATGRAAPGLGMRMQHYTRVDSQPVGRHSQDSADIVIVGNGIAGLTAAIEARRLAPNLRIVIITEQSHPTINYTHLTL